MSGLRACGRYAMFRKLSTKKACQVRRQCTEMLRSCSGSESESERDRVVDLSLVKSGGGRRCRVKW